ncbi:MAG: hypothetical protein IJO76_01925 [Clostridia bacterium]|nr:hypothetical protein [Clostridia bacterium]
MGFIIFLVVVFVLVLCCSPKKGAPNTLLGILCAILYFPIGVILALAKQNKYK